MNKNLSLGQVFTQKKEVEYSLSLIDRKFHNLSILEPSFGEGAFLIEIVKRIIKELRLKKNSEEEICQVLERNIHGYEIDKSLYKNAIARLAKNIKRIRDI